jgi:hypothetical protein
MDEVLTTIVSVPFAMAVTSLLRKKWPQIDGTYVPILVLFLSLCGALLGHYKAHIPTEVWAVLGPFASTILALGADSYVSGKIDKRNSVAEDWKREYPTRKDIK